MLPVTHIDVLLSGIPSPPAQPSVLPFCATVDQPERERKPRPIVAGGIDASSHRRRTGWSNLLSSDHRASGTAPIARNGYDVACAVRSRSASSFHIAIAIAGSARSTFAKRAWLSARQTTGPRATTVAERGPPVEERDLAKEAAYPSRQLRPGRPSRRDLAVEHDVERVTGLACSNDRGLVVEPSDASGAGDFVQVPSAQPGEQRYGRSGCTSAGSCFVAVGATIRVSPSDGHIGAGISGRSTA